MALYQCWYDTAGSEDDTGKGRLTLVTAGVAALDAKWVKFDDAWSRTLAEFGVSELHMRLFAHSKGEYASLHGDHDRRARLISSLTAVAKRGINKAFVNVLPLPDYDAVNREYRIAEEIGSPYAMNQALACATSMAWLHDRKGGHHVADFFVSDGDNGQGTFVHGAERFLGWKPTPLPPRDPSGNAFTPFQLCDLIAYEHRLRYNRLMTADTSRPVREAFTNMRRTLPVDVAFMDEPALRRWCGSAGITRRV